MKLLWCRCCFCVDDAGLEACDALCGCIKCRALWIMGLHMTFRFLYWKNKMGIMRFLYFFVWTSCTILFSASSAFRTLFYCPKPFTLRACKRISKGKRSVPTMRVCVCVCVCVCTYTHADMRYKYSYDILRITHTYIRVCVCARARVLVCGVCVCVSECVRAYMQIGGTNTHMIYCSITHISTHMFASQATSVSCKLLVCEALGYPF